MCGIIAAISKQAVNDKLLISLQQLEYRGYDSAGLALIDQQQLYSLRQIGKVAQLAQKLQQQPLPAANVGIGHTRWATHGKVTEANAHPQISRQRIAVVHNGIIENYLNLKKQLISQGYRFQSNTDSEVIAHLIHSHCQQQPDLRCATWQAIQQLDGSFALAVIDCEQPEQIILARQGASPLIIGTGDHGIFASSDLPALLSHCKQCYFLQEGDCAVLEAQQFQVYDAKQQACQRPVQHYQAQTSSATCLGNYRHYMQKEIFEQPDAIQATLNNPLLSSAELALIRKAEQIHIIACGSSYHAGLVGKIWLEQLSDLSCQVEIASEYRYRRLSIKPNTILLAISQSGETADTLAAFNHPERQYLAKIALSNQAQSSLTRLADISLQTLAGNEIGVAASKTFSCQLLILLRLALAWHKQQSHTPILTTLGNNIKQILKLDQQIQQLATQFQHKQHAFYIARGLLYPIAMEGALKLKEISYIHAESYASGELKHGALALIDNDMPVIALLCQDNLVEKVLSNLAEIQTRGGNIILFHDQTLSLDLNELTQIALPSCHPLLAPILYTIPLQLLAYHIAQIKGTDADKPRNLAKSVTVE